MLFMRILPFLLFLTLPMFGLPMLADDAVEALLAQGKDLIAKRDFEGAIAVYGRAITAAPDDPRAYLERGHRYLNTRKFKEGLADLDRAEQLAPNVTEVAYHRALAHYLMGDFKAAAKIYKACLGAKIPASGKDTLRTCGPDLEKDPGGRIGMTDWAYRALRRSGDLAGAQNLLLAIPDGLKVEAGDEAYYRTIRYYKRAITAEQALDGLKGVYFAGTGYGIANYLILSGKKAPGCELLRKVLAVEDGHYGWGAVAAEVEQRRSCGAKP